MKSKLIEIKNNQVIREEITDLLSDKAIQEFKVGKVLRFNYEDSLVTIKITRIDRKNKRAWGEHIELVDQKIVRGHYGHAVDTTQQLPFCTDCELPVNQPSTEDGEKKYKDREDRYLEDGTPIN